MMKLVIPGEPVPQARPRFTRTGIAYTTDKCRNYREYIHRVATSFMASNDLGPQEAALAVTVMFYRMVPQSWSKAKKAAALKGAIRPASKPDIDNYVKAVLDGLNRIVWKDDNQIVRLVAEKYYSDNPRVEVAVVPVF